MNLKSKILFKILLSLQVLVTPFLANAVENFQKYQTLTYDMELSPVLSSLPIVEKAGVLRVQQGSMMIIRNVALTEVKVKEEVKQNVNPDFILTFALSSEVQKFKSTKPLNHWTYDLPEDSHVFTRVIRRNGAEVINVVVVWDSFMKSLFIKNTNSIQDLLAIVTKLGHEIYGKVSYLKRIKNRQSYATRSANNSPNFLANAEAQLTPEEKLSIEFQASERIIQFVDRLLGDYNKMLTPSVKEFLMLEKEREQRFYDFFKPMQMDSSAKILKFPSSRIKCSPIF